MNFRVVIQGGLDEERRQDLTTTIAGLLGLPEEEVAQRLEASPPWVIDTAERGQAQAIASRLDLAFGLQTRLVPAVGEPSSRARGFVAALDDVARRNSVDQARQRAPQSTQAAPSPVAESPPEPVAEVEPAPPRPAHAAEKVDGPDEGSEGLQLELTPRQQRTPQPTRPTRAVASEPIAEPTPLGKRTLVLVLTLAVATGVYLLREPEIPPDLDAPWRELRTAMRHMVQTSEHAWKASQRFPPNASTTAAGFKCNKEGQPARRRRDVRGWDNGAWMFVRFPPSASYLEYHFESGGEGDYAWFVARAVGDLDCDGEALTYEMIGHLRSGMVLHARRDNHPSSRSR